MADEAVALYLATLAEVQRQAAQMNPGRGGEASADSGSDWVVLESQSTPAQLPGEEGCSLWPQQQWAIGYEILFCQCPPSISQLRCHQADDMLFFVYTDEAAAANRSRLTVRRRQSKQPSLPPDLRGPVAEADPGGSKAAQVDWRASVLLMVVLQSAYRLSVVTAADAELLSGCVDGPPPSGAADSQLHHVTKVVHASPSHVAVNLDDTRSDAGRPLTSYPDICFAVDTCDDAFQNELLRNPTDCYCVLLHADLASSWRLPATQAVPSSETPATNPARAATAQLAGLALGEQRHLGSGSLQPPHGSSQAGTAVADGGSSRSSEGSSRQWHSAQSEAGGAEAAVTFSGYVSHEQLTAALGSQLLGGDPLHQVLRAAAAAARGAQQGQGQPLATCRVVMKGPAGGGVADVAVSSFLPDGGAAALSSPPQQQPQQPQQQPPSRSRPNLLARAQLLAKGVAAAAKQVPKRGGGAGGVPVEELHLRCALMTLQVPVELLADSILRAIHL
ncbi:hypothetical protein D9Q98_005170 [Chlorella vulgaris]|uniref:Uncharacterized protein n=1 Tax=Chlorella vulgaris TaxID=3077 RepID=A0A9D4TNS9_CHLVU|nr:hypothetical protein D9Q98_005170 [Chlorella vulgaris]